MEGGINRVLNVTLVCVVHLDLRFIRHDLLTGLFIQDFAHCRSLAAWMAASHGKERDIDTHVKILVKVQYTVCEVPEINEVQVKKILLYSQG